MALAAEEDCKFVPFVMETYGGFGSHAKNFIDELVRQSKEHEQPSLTRFRDYAIRSLSICLLNGNCFVLHNGCLRLREWEGKYRRDRRRQSSPTSHKPSIPASHNLIVNLTLIPDDTEPPSKVPEIVVE